MKRRTAKAMAELLVETTITQTERLAGKEIPQAEELKRKLKALMIEKMIQSAEPTVGEMEDFRQRAANLDNFLRVLVAPTMKELLKKLPHNRGGRHRALPPDKVNRACRDMAMLLYQGVEKVPACKRIAAKYAISRWTMKRYWGEYQKANLAAQATDLHKNAETRKTTGNKRATVARRNDADLKRT